MFAVISHKGNQHKVEVDKQYRIDLFCDAKEDQKTITFSDVLLISDEKEALIGGPTVAGASVEAEIIGSARDKKVRVSKFKAKKRYKREANHRQGYTVIKVVAINKNEK